MGARLPFAWLRFRFPEPLFSFSNSQKTPLIIRVTHNPTPNPQRCHTKEGEKSNSPFPSRSCVFGCLSLSPIHFLPNLFPTCSLYPFLYFFISLRSFFFVLLLPPSLVSTPSSAPTPPPPPSRRSSRFRAPCSALSAPPREECPAPPEAARPPLLPCPPTMRSGSSHLPIKAKCMLPAPDQSPFPVLSCGSPQPLSWILRAQGKTTLLQASDLLGVAVGNKSPLVHTHTAGLELILMDARSAAPLTSNWFENKLLFER